MALNKWAKLVLTTLASAFVLASAQLGIVQGLRIVDWGRISTFTPEVATGNSWRQLLVWVTFSFAAAIIGALVVAGRSIRSAQGFWRALAYRLVATFGASLGAAAAFPLVWGPARSVSPAVAPDAVLTVAACAGIGVLAGLVLGLVALSARPAAIGLLACIGWTWLVAAACAVAWILFDSRTAPIVRLGMLDAPQLANYAQWKVGPAVMIAAAAWLSLITALVARSRSAHPFAMAIAGLAGPGLVAFAYLAAGPGNVRTPNQLEAYVTALIGAVAAQLVSLTIALTGRRIEPAKPSPAPAAPLAPPGRAFAAIAPTVAAPVARAAIGSTALTMAAPVAPPEPTTTSARGTAKGTRAKPAKATATPVARVIEGQAIFTAPPEPVTAPTEVTAPTKPASKQPDRRRNAGKASLADIKPAPPVQLPQMPPVPQTSASRTAPQPAPPAKPAQAPAAKFTAPPPPATTQLPIPTPPAQPPRPAPPAQLPPLPPPPIAQAMRQSSSAMLDDLDEEEERTLRKAERDHIDWVRNLVSLPASPELSEPRRRG